MANSNLTALQSSMGNLQTQVQSITMVLLAVQFIFLVAGAGLWLFTRKKETLNPAYLVAALIIALIDSGSIGLVLGTIAAGIYVILKKQPNISGFTKAFLIATTAIGAILLILNLAMIFIAPAAIKGIY